MLYISGTEKMCSFAPGRVRIGGRGSAIAPQRIEKEGGREEAT